MKPYLRTLEGEANFAPHRPRLQARGPGDEGSFLHLTREDLAAMSQKELDVLSQRAKDKSRWHRLSVHAEDADRLSWKWNHSFLATGHKSWHRSGIKNLKLAIPRSLGRESKCLYSAEHRKDGTQKRILLYCDRAQRFASPLASTLWW